MKGVHLVIVTDISKVEYEDIRKASGKDDKFHFSGVTYSSGTTSNEIYYVEHTNIKQTNFTFSNTYEELFHAGQNQFYSHNGITNANNTTRELEAKIAKTQAFYLINQNLSATDLSKKMTESGFSSYEMNLLIDTKNNTLKNDVVNYFKGSNMTVTTSSAVYDEISEFANDIIGNYQMNFSQSIGDFSFKFLNKLQEDKKQVAK